MNDIFEGETNFGIRTVHPGGEVTLDITRRDKVKYVPHMTQHGTPINWLVLAQRGEIPDIPRSLTGKVIGLTCVPPPGEFSVTTSGTQHAATDMVYLDGELEVSLSRGQAERILPRSISIGKIIGLTMENEGQAYVIWPINT